MSSSFASGSQQQSPSNKPTPEQVRAAAQAVGFSLGDQVYAVVGGAACLLLCSSRVTEDVDVVVSQGATKETRLKLKSQDAYFDSIPPVEVEILAPPSLFKEKFSSSTPYIVVEGIRVLKPALILNAKCHSIINRASEDKKRTDSLDIQFCLWWCAKNKAFPTATEVPRATKEFVEWFIPVFGGQELWVNAKYNFETGEQTLFVFTYLNLTDEEDVVSCVEDTELLFAGEFDELITDEEAEVLLPFVNDEDELEMVVVIGFEKELLDCEEDRVEAVVLKEADIDFIKRNLKSRR